MILWKDSGDNPNRAVRLRAYRIGAAFVCTLATVLFSIAHFHGRIRPDRLASAGKIELTRLSPSMSPNAVLPASEGRGNAAAHYVLALNSYAQRRIPYLKNRGFKPFVNEPPVTRQEIRELELGALRSFCDFYEAKNGKPLFTFIKAPNGPWKFARAKDPAEPRPYYTALRLLLVGILYQADDLKQRRSYSEASWRYELVARVGAHLLQRPGCLLDYELGLEMQLKALRSLETIPFAGDEGRSRLAEYRRAVERLGERYRHKYGQLDNPEAAALIAAKDEDPVWRLEAIASLRRQSRYHALGLLENRAIAASLEQAMTGARGAAKSGGERIARSQRPASSN